MLITHILIAFVTLGICAFQLARPSINGIYIGRLGIIATLTSGTVLTVISNTSIARLCFSGIAFVFVCGVLTFVGEKQLAK